MFIKFIQLNRPPMHTAICMMIFPILTFNNYCVTCKAVILRDSGTKTARRKCQRILGKQSKAFELMRQGTEERNPCPNLPAFIQSLLKVHLLPTVGPLSPAFTRWFPSPSDSESETNKPLSDVMEAGVVICEEESSSHVPSRSFTRLILSEVFIPLLFHNNTNCRRICLKSKDTNSMLDCKFALFSAPRSD